MIYEVVIGVEVHAQLRTKSKLFCGCGTRFGLPANSQTCPLCLGLPGTLPVINQAAVEMAVRAGLALNCTVATNNVFARKNYFYPDLPKGYQISQYESPICEHSWIEIAASEGTRRVRIRRAHLEEDAGKSVHVAGTNGSRVDLNRAGTPLLEIVTEPDLRSADEVVAYLKGLRDVLMYQDVCDGDMENSPFPCHHRIHLDTSVHRGGPSNKPQLHRPNVNPAPSRSPAAVFPPDSNRRGFHSYRRHEHSFRHLLPDGRDGYGRVWCPHLRQSRSSYARKSAIRIAKSDSL